MGTDGGALLYIGEDDDEQPMMLQLIDVARAAERVRDIGSTSI